ncbi:MAG: N-acetyl-gamma-glutamyl-phosphate reductase [Planctomycetota bacterium]
MTAVAIYGATGYGGQELLRYLAQHPSVVVAAVFSERNAGRPVAEVLPALEGFYRELAFSDPAEPPPPECAGAFLATPHGASRDLARRIAAARPDVKIVDLSMDFRLEEEGFVYGLTETNRGRIREARWVANPGCFATGALLALAPLYERDLVDGDVVLAQTTGSSGSGAQEKPGTHHPERAQDQRAYRVLDHQHLGEIEAELRRFGCRGCAISMVPQSGPFSRGIFTVAHFRADPGADVAALYRERYAREPFVRLRNESPALRHVARTNFCDVSVHADRGRVVVLTAIDNLGKGMAGEAIQNMNLLLGLEETAGLLVPGANP